MGVFKFKFKIPLYHGTGTITNGHVDLISENLEEDAMVNISS